MVNFLSAHEGVWPEQAKSLESEVEDELFLPDEAQLSASDPFNLSRVVPDRPDAPHEGLVVALERFVLLLQLVEPLLQRVKPRETALAEDQRRHREEGDGYHQAREQDH